MLSLPNCSTNYTKFIITVFTYSIAKRQVKEIILNFEEKSVLCDNYTKYKPLLKLYSFEINFQTYLKNHIHHGKYLSYKLALSIRNNKQLLTTQSTNSFNVFQTHLRHLIITLHVTVSPKVK